MKKFFLLSSILILSLTKFSSGQAPLIKQWDSRFGGTDNDVLATFRQTSDKGFILAGFSFSAAGGDKTENNRGPASTSDFWLVKADANGNRQWDKRFGGSRNDELHAASQTSDRGYILAGNSTSGISGDKTQANWDTSTGTSTTVMIPSADYWIVKTDARGNKQWDKRFGGTYQEELHSIEQTRDGGYILGGCSYSSAGGDCTEPTRGSADYWIVKTDAQGNRQWDKRFGGTNNDQLYSVKQTTNGGFILGGHSWSQADGDKTYSNQGTANNSDYWVIKTDSAGNKQWDKNFGGTGNDFFSELQLTTDGGYILAGYSFSGMGGDKTEPNHGLSSTADFWIIKIDSGGNKLWDRDFGGNAKEDEFGNIVQTSDKGFLLTGTSYSDINGNKSESNLGVEQAWMIKTDSAGVKQWDKTIFTSGHDEGGFALQAENGSYAVAACTNAIPGGYKTQPNRDSTNLTYDFWISKFTDSTFVPVLDFTLSSENICPNGCTNFTNNSQGYDSFQWIFNGASISASMNESPQNVCYSQPGNYDVILIGFRNNSSDTLTVNHCITVHPLPQPFTIAYPHDTLYAPQGFAIYQWYYFSTAISQATNYFYPPTLSGSYTVEITDSNGCSASAQIENIKAAIPELNNEGEAADVFPNPASNSFTVMLSRPEDYIKGISVFNSLGQEVYVSHETMADRHHSAETINETFPDGIYLLKILSGNKTTNKKLVVKK